MADRPTLYAQFEGDEINGKFYALGEEIAESVDLGTLQYLKGQGRIASAPPLAAIVVPSPDRPLDELSRDEMEAKARSLVDLSHYSDEDLRDRLAQMIDGKNEDIDEEDDLYSDIKDKPLTTMTTAQLNAVADAEGVTFAEDDTTNAKRAAAIQAKRDAAPPPPPEG